MPCARSARRPTSETRLVSLNAELETEPGHRHPLPDRRQHGRGRGRRSATRTALVTGDTVNTAARLEQAAAPGEILLGRGHLPARARRGDVEPVEPIAPRARPSRCEAYRLVSVVQDGEGHRRRLDSPLVGREDELALLRDRLRAGDGGADTAACHSPGLQPASARAASSPSSPAGASQQPTILQGHCLPYGDGIAYWPLREILHMAADIGEGKLGGGGEGQARCPGQWRVRRGCPRSTRRRRHWGLAVRAPHKKRSSGPHAGSSSTWPRMARWSPSGKTSIGRSHTAGPARVRPRPRGRQSNPPALPRARGAR